MKDSLTALEKKWILYDVGNSAFTMMVSTIFPIYFNALSSDAGLDATTYLAYWGYALTISTIIVLIAGPILGALSDKKGRKKIIFAATIIAGSVCTMFMGFARQWLIFLIVFIIAKVFYQLTLIIYDSTLTDITTMDRMDRVSSSGYAWGYIGSCIPFIACLVLVLNAGAFGMGTSLAMTLAFLLVGIWWLGTSVPLLKVYRQKYYLEGSEKKEKLLPQLGHTLKQMASDKKVLLFVLAFFFYIDGVYTIIDMSTAYGSALGLDSTGLLLALLVTQFVAFPCAIIFGRLAQKKSAGLLITICIIAYFGITLFAVFMSAQIHFWILAVCVGIFQGGIQALSRSYFAKIIPPEKSGEYFSFLDICGKGASVFGTLLMSILTQLTGNQRIGVSAIALLFIVGLVLFRLSVRAGSTKV